MQRGIIDENLSMQEDSNSQIKYRWHGEVENNENKEKTEYYYF